MREIADHRAEGAALPQIGAVPVEIDAADIGLDHTDEQARQGRLAGAGRPDHAEHLAGREREGDALDHRLRLAGRRIDHPVYHEVALAGRRRHRLALRAAAQYELAHPLPGSSGQNPLPPVGDHRIERRQQPAEQDARGHQRTGRHLVADDQHGAGRIDRKLHRHPGGAGQGGDELAAPRAHVELLDHGELLAAPALGQRRQHAHRLDRLGMAQAGADLVDAGDAGLVGILENPASQHVRKHAEQQQNDQRGKADEPVDRVQREEHGEEDRRPDRLQRRGDRRARDEEADIVEVANRLRRLPGALFERRAHRRLQSRQIELACKNARHRLEGQRADELDHAVKRQRPHRDHQQHRQRVIAAADGDPVLHLHHEERDGQQQQVHAQAEKGRIAQAADEGALEIPNQGVGRRLHSLHAGLRD